MRLQNQDTLLVVCRVSFVLDILAEIEAEQALRKEVKRDAVSGIRSRR